MRLLSLTGLIGAGKLKMPPFLKRINCCRRLPRYTKVLPLPIPGFIIKLMRLLVYLLPGANTLMSEPYLCLEY
jgi:hypothetical protein